MTVNKDKVVLEANFPVIASNKTKAATRVTTLATAVIIMSTTAALSITSSPSITVLATTTSTVAVESISQMQESQRN